MINEGQKQRAKISEWHKVHITDKSGKKFFNTTASPMSAMSEVRNLKHHLEAAKRNPSAYQFIDLASAVIMLDGEVYSEPNLTDDQLLEALS